MRALLCVAALSVSIAPSPLQRETEENDPRDADLACIQGDWDVILWKLATPLGGTGRDWGLSAQIKGKRIVFSRNGKPETEWVIRLDATKTPPSINIKENGRVGLRPSVYRLERKTFTVRVEMADRLRPKKVEKDGTGVVNLYLILKRPIP